MCKSLPPDPSDCPHLTHSKKKTPKESGDGPEDVTLLLYPLLTD